MCVISAWHRKHPEPGGSQGTARAGRTRGGSARYAQGVPWPCGMLWMSRGAPAGENQAGLWVQQLAGYAEQGWPLQTVQLQVVSEL